jgi:restriction endonuclease Mrr
MTTELMLPARFTDEWAVLYQDTLQALLGQYAKRGPQYQLLAELAAGLYTQTRRLEVEAPEAVRLHLQAVEALRKVIDQAQRYTEARRQEVVVSEVNNAVVEALRITETMVDPLTFKRIIVAVRSALAQHLA